VQLCYRMAGYILPRDAYQQHDALSQSVKSQEMRGGDLIFFGRERVTHVALALDKHKYIHAEGDNQVTVNSLDPQDPVCSASRAEVTWTIKRVCED
jgi:gamma-D-glutamyl-L-lysine dipeptidyl-peptidase